MRRIPDDAPVITGVGIVTALGHGTETNAKALLAGRTAVAPAGAGRAAIAEPPFLRSPVPETLEPQIKFLNGAGKLAVEAALEAMEHASVARTAPDPSRVGLFLAQRESYGWTCTDYRPAFLAATREFREPLEAAALNRASVRRIKPFFLLENLHNNAFSFLAARFGLRGTNASCAGFGAASGPLLDLAVQAVMRGDLDAALVVGAGRMTGPVARHESSRLPGTAREPLGAPGDGAGALLIERAETARSRDVKALASLGGFGLATGRPASPWQLPPAEAVRAAVGQAISGAAIGPAELRAVVVPVPGERTARDWLAVCLDDSVVGNNVPWLCWRGATGDMGMASLVVEVGLAAAGMTAGRLPATNAGADGPPTAPYASSPTDVDGGAILVLHVGWLGEVGAVMLNSA